MTPTIVAEVKQAFRSARPSPDLVILIFDTDQGVIELRMSPFKAKTLAKYLVTTFTTQTPGTIVPPYSPEKK